MLSVFGFLCLGFIFSVTLTPAVRSLAIRLDLVDSPDGRRKLQSAPIPLSGGLGVVISVWAALLLALLIPNPLQEQLVESGPALLGLFLASLVICAVGLADDFGYLRGRHKLLGQLVAIAIMLNSGLVVRHVRLSTLDFDLGLLAWPFTAFWLLGAINSLNFIDGLDGLLGCIGVITGLALGTMALLQGHLAAACVAFTLAGALIGFLRYNLPPATIFLGDSGSMFIGLVIGVLGIESSLKAPATIALAAPLAIFTIPIFDTTAAIIRRKLTGRSVYTTDRGHLHHCLLRHGLSNRRVLLVVSVFCLLTVAGALASQTFKNEIYAVLTALAVVGILIATRLFGYAEFLLVKERLRGTAASFLRMRSEAQPQRIEIRLQGSTDWKDSWNALTAYASQIHLRMVRLDINAPSLHEGYHASWIAFDENSDDNAVLWRAEIPLVFAGQTAGRVEIVGPMDTEPVWKKVADFEKLVDHLSSTFIRVAGPPVESPVLAPKIAAARAIFDELPTRN